MSELGATAALTHASYSSSTRMAVHPFAKLSTPHSISYSMFLCVCFFVSHGVSFAFVVLSTALRPSFDRFYLFVLMV